MQVSSFSVYGPVEVIDADSPIAPATAYGRSKAEAEDVLDAMRPTLSTLNVRLPFLLDRERPASLRPLIELFRRSPVFPVPRYPVHRSMLTYADAAALLVCAAGNDQSGAVSAADPQLFSMDLLKRLMHESGLRTPILTRVSPLAVRLIGHIRPDVRARLFASSELAPAANWAIGRELPVGLVREIGSLLARQFPANSMTRTAAAKVTRSATAA